MGINVQKLTVTSTSWISSSAILSAQCTVLCHVTFKIGASQSLHLVGWLFYPPSVMFGITSFALEHTRKVPDTLDSPF